MNHMLTTQDVSTLISPALLSHSYAPVLCAVCWRACRSSVTLILRGFSTLKCTTLMLLLFRCFFFSSSQFTHVCSNRYDRSPVLNRTCTLTLTRCCYALQFNPTISWRVDLEMSRRIQELLGHVCAIRAQLSVKKM